MEESVSSSCNERTGITYFDGMDRRDGHPRNCHRREDVPSNLEQAHHQRSLEHGLGRLLDTPSASRPDAPSSPRLTRHELRSSQSREAFSGGEEDDAVPCYEGELNESEGDGVAELGHDGFARVGGEG